MRFRIEVLLCVFSCWGCASAGQQSGAPNIAVNQAGLSERLLLVEKKPEVEETKPNEAAPNVAAVELTPKESDDPGNEHPKKPDPELSSRRIGFRRSGESEEAEERLTKEPDRALGSERDYRRALFEAREKERLGSVGRQ